MMITTDMEENNQNDRFRHVAVIIKPVSCVRKRDTWLKTIRQHYPQARISTTTYAGHALQIAGEIQERPDTLLIIIGGDGTINEVINGLKSDVTAIRILPGGSGNGFLRHLKRLHKQGLTMTLADVWELNKRQFINLAGAGFDAHMAYRYRNLKMRGFFAYAVSFFLALLRHRSQKYNIETDDGQWPVKAYMITLANGSQFGFGTQIAPQARIDDGYLELIILRNFPLAIAPVLLLLSFTGKIHHSRYVSRKRVKRARISSPEKAHHHMDGEYLGCTKSIFVRAADRQIPIVL